MKRFRNGFLMKKMAGIGTGLFYNFSEDFMKTPTSVIQIRHSDRKGNLYFDLPRPYRDMQGIEKTFFSKIQFFNRSCNMHVMAEGYASILDDYDERERIFIQFHLTKAYGLLHRKRKWKGLSGWIQKISDLLSKDYTREPDWMQVPAF
jgi:hypothetical protein